MSFWEILRDLGIVMGGPVLRSASGWAVKALADAHVTFFELKQLGATVIRVGTMGFLGYLGFSIIGIENAALSAAIGSFFADKIFNAIKTRRKDNSMG